MSRNLVISSHSRNRAKCWVLELERSKRMFPLFDDNDDGSSCGVATNFLIILNLIAFAMQAIVPNLMEPFVLTPHLVLIHQQSLLNLLSHCFLHGGVGHLLTNMWYLFVFGDNVEDRMGSFNFLIFYLCCGVLSGLAELIIYPNGQSFVGASGAISGVMAAYLILHPGNRIRCFIGLPFFFPRLPSFILIGSFILMNSLMYMADPSMVEGISYAGHIGGFIAGLLFVRLAAKDCRD